MKFSFLIIAFYMDCAFGVILYIFIYYIFIFISLKYFLILLVISSLTHGYLSIPNIYRFSNFFPIVEFQV